MNDLLASKSKPLPSKPEIFDLADAQHCDAVRQLHSEGRIFRVVDDYEQQQLELYSVRNPSHIFSPGFASEFREYYNNIAPAAELYGHGRWAYFPWNGNLVHILDEAEFFAVRTCRNKNLINEAEQEKFYNAVVGIGGLSVGANIAFALALQGGARRMRLADMDNLALSNTNRILVGVEHLGVKKVDLAARVIYSINPYAEIETFPEGLTPENVGRFCDGLTVMIDELDSFPVKFLIREQCRERGIPILMAADNGDNGVLDVERHDLGQVPFYQGRLGGELKAESFENLDKMAIGKMITQLVGPENVTERMQQSLLEIGKTLVSWPQLGGAALLNAAAVAACVRRIVNGQPVEPNRALLNLDALIDPTHHTLEQVTARGAATERFRRMFGL